MRPGSWSTALMQPRWYFITYANQLTWAGGWVWGGNKIRSTLNISISCTNRKKKKSRFCQPPSQLAKEHWLYLQLRCPWIKYNQILVQMESGEREASSFMHPSGFLGYILVKDLAESYSTSFKKQKQRIPLNSQHDFTCIVMLSVVHIIGMIVMRVNLELPDFLQCWGLKGNPYPCLSGSLWMLIGVILWFVGAPSHCHLLRQKYC